MKKFAVVVFLGWAFVQVLSGLSVGEGMKKVADSRNAQIQAAINQANGID